MVLYSNHQAGVKTTKTHDQLLLAMGNSFVFPLIDILPVMDIAFCDSVNQIYGLFINILKIQGDMMWGNCQRRV